MRTVLRDGDAVEGGVQLVIDLEHFPQPARGGQLDCEPCELLDGKRVPAAVWSAGYGVRLCPSCADAPIDRRSRAADLKRETR